MTVRVTLLAGLASFAFVIYLLIPPFVDQTNQFVDDVPGIVRDLEGRMRKVEQAIRSVEEEQWSRSDPEKSARAGELVLKSFLNL